MKNLTKVLAIAVMGLFLVAAGASATQISFSGDVLVADKDNNGFKEFLDFGTGWINSAYTPEDDAVFNDGVISPEFFGWESVEIAPLTLNSDFTFSNTPIAEGFKVYDNWLYDGNPFTPGRLLFSATLNLYSLIPYGQGSIISPTFEANLTNIKLGAEYTLGESEIVDSFLYAWEKGSAIDITLSWQMEDDMVSFFNTTGSEKFTYSGTTAPVPEPATMFLLGSGLVGLGVIRRKKRTA